MINYLFIQNWKKNNTCEVLVNIRCSVFAGKLLGTDLYTASISTQYDDHCHSALATTFARARRTSINEITFILCTNKEGGLRRWQL